MQQQLALAAAEVAAASAAAEAAARAADADGVLAAELPIAMAKARTSEAAGTVARIAHQVHGAIGFTREHDLRLATTRLWAWRDEDGSEAQWQEVVGAAALAAGAGRAVAADHRSVTAAHPLGVRAVPRHARSAGAHWAA